MKKAGKKFEVGDLVFAKVRGYPPWPARVSGIKAAGKYHVYFFGTYETAVIKKEDIWLYSPETKERYGKQKRKGFAEGLLELETNPNIGLEIPGAADLQHFGDVTAADQSTLAADESTLGADTSAVAEGAAADESAVTAAAAVDESVAEAAGSADEAPLTIDETPNKKTAAVAKGKRKAEDTPSGGQQPPAKKRAAAAAKTPRGRAAAPAAAATGLDTPNAAAATDGAAAVASTPGESGKTSRSGRVIKQKKFADDIEGGTPTPAKGTPTEKKAPSEVRKMWVHVKPTGDMLEINLDKDRPANFDSKEAEIQWEKATAKNALKFKQTVESGEFIPEEIRKKLEEKAVRTPKEEEILKKEKVLACRKEKVRWLKVEQRLIDLDVAIKTALHYQHPNMTKCLEHLEELTAMPVAPLMFKKQPEIVTTMRKLRKYIGPEDEPADPEVGLEWATSAEKIRLRADAIFHKIQSCFSVPDGTSFWDAFETQLMEFRNVTKDMEPEQVLHLVTDPTPSANT